MSNPSFDDDTRITGDSDGTRIGNVGDRLKVTQSVGPNIQSGIPTVGSNLCYEDMNPSTGGVNRNTNIGSSWTSIYSVTGSGLFAGFLVTLEDPDDDWFIRLVVDGNEIFKAAGIEVEDLEDDDRYGIEYGDPDDGFNQHIGFGFKENTIFWRPPMGTWMAYNSTIQVLLRKVGDTDFFRAGLAVRTV